MSKAADADAIAPFQPLDDYERPAMPTEETIRRLIRRARIAIGRPNDAPFKSADLLRRTTLETLDDIVAPPASGHLLRELQASLEPWIADPAPRDWLRVIVLPPCDANGSIETWAKRQGHEILSAPGRDELVCAETPAIPRLDGEGVLVLPQLERWFLRHRNGLGSVRALLAAIGQLRRHTVIGCNSWAWTFLGMAVGADTLLPPATTFQAFDAPRLGTWFRELATSDQTHATTFRLSADGEDVLARGEDDTLTSDYLEKLAARSLGIPWVAWQLWRTSLRSERAGDDDEAPGGDDEAPRVPHETDPETLWIADLEEFIVPPRHKDDVLLVMQALLIHGALTGPELAAVLPAGNWHAVLPIMLRARLVQDTEGLLRCRAAAYPAMRSDLAAAGYSVPRF